MPTPNLHTLLEANKPEWEEEEEVRVSEVEVEGRQLWTSNKFVTGRGTEGGGPGEDETWGGRDLEKNPNPGYKKSRTGGGDCACGEGEVEVEGEAEGEQEVVKD